MEEPLGSSVIDAAVADGRREAPLAQPSLPPPPLQQQQQPELCSEYSLTLGGACAPVLDHGSSAGHPAVTGLRRYLCLFLHRYLEFRLPEVEALVEAAMSRLGIEAVSDSDDSSGGGGRADVVGADAGRRDGVEQHQWRHMLVWEKPYGNCIESPYWYIHLPGPNVAKEVRLCGPGGWAW